MKFRPINGRILVKPLEAKEKTSGGIYLPDTAKERLHEGKVIAEAEDATDEVAVGDQVIYKEYGGTEVKLDREDYILLTEDDLLAKHEGGDSTKLKPINGRVLLKPSEVKEKTSGGIYIPDTAKEKLHEGEVIAVAKDATEEIALGVHVIYKEYGGTEVKLNREDYILLAGDDLLAKHETVDEIPE